MRRPVPPRPVTFPLAEAQQVLWALENMRDDIEALIRHVRDAETDLPGAAVGNAATRAGTRLAGAEADLSASLADVEAMIADVQGDIAAGTAATEAHRLAAQAYWVSLRDWEHTMRTGV